MVKKYQVVIDDTVASQSFTLDELLDAGLLDDYDTNIKVRATNEKEWRVAREYPFYQSESSTYNNDYIVNRDGTITRKKRNIVNSNGDSSPSSIPRGYRIDEYGQVVRIGTTNNSNTSRLELSTTSLHFTSYGGSRSITINANEEWQISLNAASWVHLTKSGSNLMVMADQNYGSGSRTDYFRLKSGNIEKRVDIYQSGSSSVIQNMPSSVSGDSNDDDGCSWILWIAIGIGILAAIFS